MRGLKAALWKDLRLFRSGVGLFTLLLPLLLLLALRLSGGASQQGAHLEPFPIAVRDEDDTIMSRTLLEQIQKIELFSRTILADGEEDRELFAEGCAGVITIPEDFFYTTYHMTENPVEVVLNEDMPLESTVLETILTSVMDIISADQAADRAVYRLCYGDLTEEQETALLNESAQTLFLDALGRQGVFDTRAEETDIQDSVEREFFSCALSALCLFFALAAVKSLSEEKEGILPRIVAAGGSRGAFLLSRLITGALAAAPSLALLLCVFQPRQTCLVPLLGACLFLGAFGPLAAVAARAGRGDRVQRWGNLFLLLSLVLGGAIYSWDRLPGFAQILGRLTLPYYARRGLEALDRGAGVLELLQIQWFPLLTGLAGLVLAWGGMCARRPQRRRFARRPGPAEPAEASPGAGRLCRLLRIAEERTLAMSGGCGGLVCLLLCVALCGATVGYALNRSGPDALRLAAAVEDDGPLAEALVESVSGRPGVYLERTTPEEGQAMLDQGRVEGLLIVGAGYDTALEAGEDLPLSYRSASTSATARAAREIIAGQAVAQRAEVRAARTAARRLGRPLTEEEETDLAADMAREREQAPPLYTVTTRSGGSSAAGDVTAPRPVGFASLVMMLTLLTWAAWTGRADVRRVEERMAVLPDGRWLSFLGDVLALMAVGLACGVCALAPGGDLTVQTLAALAACDLCVTALALAAQRRVAGGKMDLLAPFIALITGLVGGCFGNGAALSPALRTLALLTPQGLAIRAGDGSLPALAALTAAGCLLLWVARPNERKRTKNCWNCSLEMEGRREGEKSMDFFDKVGSRLTQTGQRARNRVTALTDGAKLNQQTDELNRALAGLYQEIGEEYCRLFGGAPAEPLAELCAQVKARLEDLEMVNAEMQKVKNIRVCPSCGYENPGDVKFCSQCGTRIPSLPEPPAPVCPGCGAPLKPGARFCTRCGTKLA